MIGWNSIGDEPGWGTNVASFTNRVVNRMDSKMDSLSEFQIINKRKKKSFMLIGDSNTV